VIVVTKSDKERREEMQGFGKILTELRGEKTQEEVAKSIGIATSTLGMYETERRVPRDSIKVKIASYYKKTVQEIFFN
jgi:hypothetical protein